MATSSGRTYAQKVLGIAPANLIAYWPLWETSGAVADNLEGTAARDGAYTGVTLGSSTFSNGNPVPLFDGANDFVNIYSASLNGAFNGAEGTLAVWIKVFDASVWPDGSPRYFVHIAVNGSNLVEVSKGSSNNVVAEYIAGGVAEVFQITPITATGWIHFALTWSVAADEAKFYRDGALADTTATGLGTWAGALASNLCVIGASNSTPSNAMHGYEGHAAVWNTPLSAAQILELATV